MCAHSALTGHQHPTHAGKPRDRGRGTIDFRRPDDLGHIDAVDAHLFGDDVDLRLLRDRADHGFIVERHACAERLPSNRAIHCAAIDVTVSKLGGHGPRDSALAGA